ncbi:MAG: fused MFS/spermidine synthase [Coriobacteriia bacterium]|nr:fused MFS/spermidine synthase [Coriobacteriia bacterium]MBN2823357.1 fused MFS/spermidine synthase [Coriobacteriia bacterium]
MAETTHPRPRTHSRGHIIALLGAYALSGAAALTYEVSWMRELSSMFGSTAYASGILLSAFMTGLGLGAVLGTWLAGRSAHPLRDAARAELAVAAFSVITLLALRLLPTTYFDLIQGTGMSGASFLAVQFAVAFVVMVLPTTAMGATYPLVIEAVGRRRELGGWSGRLYSSNTAGAITGSLLAGFVLIPLVGLKGALISAAALSSVAALMFAALAIRMSGAPSILRSAEYLVLPIALLALLAIPTSTGAPLGIGQVYFYESSDQYEHLADSSKVLYEEEGVYSRVTVYEDPWGIRTLANGALDEGNSGDYDKTTTTMLALAPTASASNTRTALVVGLGTGYTSLAYHRLGFEHVTTVEINPEVPPAATYFIGELPQDDSWRVIVDDARAHLLTSTETYDAITSEPSWPWSSGVAALFTEEFMSAAKARLNPGGVYCQWLPNYLLEPEDVDMMYKTMRKVYPRVDVWAINFPEDAESELLLIGHVDGSGPSVQQTAERILELLPPFSAENPVVTEDTLSAYSRLGELEEAVADPSVPLNTDDHSTLEYRVFRNLVDNVISQPKER